MGMLLSRLLFPVILVLLLVMLFRRRTGVRGKVPRGREQCPSCHAAIRAAEGDPVSCPSCGIELVRSPDGQLRIRVR